VTPPGPPPAMFGEAPPTTVTAAPPPVSAVSANRIDTAVGIGPAFWQKGVNGTAAPSFVFSLRAGWLFGSPESRLRFRMGVLFGYTFLAANEDKSNVGFVSVLADPAVEIRLTESGRLYLDVDLAIGLQMVTGLQDRSKLLEVTNQMLSVSGAQGMTEARFGAGVGYRFTPELAAFSSMAESTSPKKQHFYSEIQRFEWLFGVAYRF
jgi:hypothetical protein